MSMIITIIICTIISILFSLPSYIQARCLRRFAEAKLEIARVMLGMERLMLAGDIKMGDVCHDHIYKHVNQALHAKKFCVEWSIWKWGRPSPEKRDLSRRLHEETDRNSEVAKLISRFAGAQFCAFRYNRPLIAAAFAMWVGVYVTGLLFLLLGLFTVYRTRQTWREFKKTVAEYYLAYSMTIAGV